MLGIRMEGVRDLLLGSVKRLQRGPLKGQGLYVMKVGMIKDRV